MTGMEQNEAYLESDELEAEEFENELADSAEEEADEHIHVEWAGFI
jgi:hypothetical protein